MHLTQNHLYLWMSIPSQTACLCDFPNISLLGRKPVSHFWRKDSRKLNICRCVEIGIRDRLKICCQQWHVGSSPTTGTTKVALKTFILSGLGAIFILLW